MSDSPYKPSESMTLGGPEPEREKLRRVAKQPKFGDLFVARKHRDEHLGVCHGWPTDRRTAWDPRAIVGRRCVYDGSIYLLAAELINAGIGVLCAILMFVPCISLIVLLVINQKATAFLQSNGIRVGFLGTSPDNI